MPLPKAYVGVLQSATPELVESAIHASAHLVLHVLGYERLNIDQRRKYETILRELLRVVKEEQDVRP